MRRTWFMCEMVVALGVTSAAWGQAGPAVTNVTATQRQDHSKLVDIRYNLASTVPCTIWVLASRDGGQTWNIPVITTSGDAGLNVNPGTGKRIVWDAPADVPGLVGTFRIRVYADDGSGMANMVYVPVDPVYPQLGSYWIDKYEVTNQRYCEFLNAVDAATATEHYDSRMEITKNTDAPYVVYAGRQNYPLVWVSYNDAVAFAAWLSQRSGLAYRLPSGDEWYKAASWDPVERKNYTYGYHQDVIDCEWCNYGSCVGGTTPVGYYNGTGGRNNAKTYYGCYDMSGNAWEWTSEGSSSCSSRRLVEQQCVLLRLHVPQLRHALHSVQPLRVPFGPGLGWLTLCSLFSYALSIAQRWIDDF